MSLKKGDCVRRKSAARSSLIPPGSVGWVVGEVVSPFNVWAIFPACKSGRASDGAWNVLTDTLEKIDG